MNATEWLIARLVPTHPDVQAGWVVNLDAEDNEISRWPVAVIPSVGLAVLLRNGATVWYRAASLADALTNRYCPVNPGAELAALIPRMGGNEPMQNIPDDVLTLDEVAALLRVKPVTIQRWQRSRGLPAARVGSTTRYRRVAVLEWLAQHEQRQGGPGNE